MDKSRGFGNATLQHPKELMMVFTLIWLEYKKFSRVFETIINSIILLCHKTTLHCEKFSVFNQSFGCVIQCFLSAKTSTSKLIVFAFLLRTSNEKFMYSVMSCNQNHDNYDVKIRFRFFDF